MHAEVRQLRPGTEKNTEAFWFGTAIESLPSTHEER